MAFIGGHLALPTHVFKMLLGLVLIFSATRLLVNAQQIIKLRNVPRAQAIVAGGGIGLLSGLTGTGGGIFLTPLLIFMGWADAKRAAAVSALFVLMNSISGLAGNIAATKALPPYILSMLIAVALGGALGAYMGSQRIESAIIKKLLAVVLLIAGLKLIFT
jgi:hypothetical protein